MSPKPSIEGDVPTHSKEDPELGNDEESHSKLDVNEKAQESQVDTKADEPYSLFSKRDKWLIISLAALAGVFEVRTDFLSPSHEWWAHDWTFQNHNSPLTANIYFPALQILADKFHTTQERMN